MISCHSHSQNSSNTRAEALPSHCCPFIHGLKAVATFMQNCPYLLGFRRAFVRNGKLLSTVFSAVGQDPTTVGRGHTFTETVLVLSFLLGRLIGAFHNKMINYLFLKGLQIWLGIVDYPRNDCYQNLEGFKNEPIYCA
jgi:hypothetical protein